MACDPATTIRISDRLCCNWKFRSDGKMKLVLTLLKFLYFLILLIKYIYLLSILIAGCPGFNNRLQCDNGYKVDRNGCPISECGSYEITLSTQWHQNQLGIQLFNFNLKITSEKWSLNISSWPASSSPWLFMKG